MSEKYLFDGINKVINLAGGITLLDVRDLYSRWKQWTQNGGSGYLQALSVVGGDPVDASQGIYVTSYFFLENDWKIRPYAGNHKLTVSNGVIVDASGGDPFIQTTGAYNVLVQYSQPVKSETIDIGGGSAPSAGIIADAVWDELVSNHQQTGSIGKVVDDNSIKIDNLEEKIDDNSVQIQSIWNKPLSEITQPTTIGGYIKQKILTTGKFIGLK